MTNGLIPKKYQRADWKRVEEPVRDEIRPLVRDRLLKGDIGAGVIFEGTNGVGKTYAACALVNAITQVGGVWTRLPVYVRAADIADLWRETDEFREQPWKKTLCESQCLIIDDLGKEDRTTDYQEGKSTHMLGNIFRARVQNEVFTIVTTNLPFDEVEDVYGKSVFSILKELATAWVMLTGADRRD